MSAISPSVFCFAKSFPFAVPEKTIGHSVLLLGFFDRGTNYALPSSATGGGRARYPFLPNQNPPCGVRRGWENRDSRIF